MNLITTYNLSGGASKATFACIGNIAANKATNAFVVYQPHDRNLRTGGANTECIGQSLKVLLAFLEQLIGCMRKFLDLKPFPSVKSDQQVDPANLVFALNPPASNRDVGFGPGHQRCVISLQE